MFEKNNKKLCNTAENVDILIMVAQAFQILPVHIVKGSNATR